MNQRPTSVPMASLKHFISSPNHSIKAKHQVHLADIHAPSFGCKKAAEVEQHSQFFFIIIIQNFNQEHQ